MFFYFDVIQHFNLIVMIDIMVVKLAKVDKIIRAMKTETNIKKVENNIFAIILLK